MRELWKNIVAAGDGNQFQHPADARNHRLVPLLEIDARTRTAFRSRGGDVETGAQILREQHTLLGHADERR